MELFEILQSFINSMGFPIAMVLYFIYDKKTTMESLTKAVENNTLVMTKLLAKLGADDVVEVAADPADGVIA